ncbi:MAG: hypothetical protein MPK09_03380 [Gammaproteobacteria bacterium]|nr:hypothetical protein [Gammaproteobacteria bacterium]
MSRDDQDLQDILTIVEYLAVAIGVTLFVIWCMVFDDGLVTSGIPILVAVVGHRIVADHVRDKYYRDHPDRKPNDYF